MTFEQFLAGVFAIAGLTIGSLSLIRGLISPTGRRLSVRSEPVPFLLCLVSYAAGGHSRSGSGG